MLDEEVQHFLTIVPKPVAEFIRGCTFRHCSQCKCYLSEIDGFGSLLRLDLIDAFTIINAHVVVPIDVTRPEI